MKHHQKKQSFILKPVYPGGKKALQEFIKTNLKYPKTSLENKIEGTVYISYRVDFDGKTIEIKVNKGLDDACNQEACRVVSLLAFSPQNNHGVKVSTQQKINIHFKLPAPPPPNTHINYQVKAKSNTQKPQEQPKVTYGYTIKFNG